MPMMRAIYVWPRTAAWNTSAVLLSLGVSREKLQGPSFVLLEEAVCM